MRAGIHAAVLWAVLASAAVTSLHDAAVAQAAATGQAGGSAPVGVQWGLIAVSCLAAVYWDRSE